MIDSMYDWMASEPRANDCITTLADLRTMVSHDTGGTRMIAAHGGHRLLVHLDFAKESFVTQKCPFKAHMLFPSSASIIGMQRQST